MITNHDLALDIEKILIDQPALQERICSLAAEIEADYKELDDLLVVCVLKGSYIFLADLSREIKRPHEIDFMAVSSYGASTKSSGVVQIVLDLSQNVSGRHLLLVEDIIDSGHTLSYLRRLLLARNPASLRICTLLNKPSRRESDVPVDYVGFDIPDEFVIGYGLDFNQIYRNLPYIGILKRSVFSEA